MDNEKGALELVAKKASQEFEVLMQEIVDGDIYLQSKDAADTALVLQQVLVNLIEQTRGNARLVRGLLKCREIQPPQEATSNDYFDD